MTHQSTSEVNTNSKIMNPGTYLDLNEKYRSILPNLFDGLRVLVHRSLSHQFKAKHFINFSSITPGNYRFGVTYVGDKQIGANKAVPVLIGDIDTSGKTNASIYHLFGSKLKFKFDSQMDKSLFVTSQLTTHYLGDNFTASAVLSNADIMKNSGGLLLQYLQNVTPNLALGTELAFVRNLTNNKYPMKIENETQVSVVGRYTTAHTVWCSVLSLNNILLSCYKQVSDQLEFGVELDTNIRYNESHCTFAYKINLPYRGIHFRAYVDTNTNVGSVFEKRISGTPFSLLVSANLNHSKSNFRLGLGFNVE